MLVQKLAVNIYKDNKLKSKDLNLCCHQDTSSFIPKHKSSQMITPTLNVAIF